MNRTIQSIMLWILILSLPGLAWGAEEKQEYKFELSEIEKKPYHLGGYGEFRPVLNGLDRDSALYKLKFYNLDEGKTTEEYNFKLLVDASYEQDNARFFLRLSYDVNNTYLGWQDDLTPYEAFLSLKPSPSLTLDTGKKVAKWGKGYAWNPVAFIDRPKDPDEPDLALEGYWVLSADWIRSFSGPLKTLSFTPVFLPVLDGINDDFGKTDQANIAGKIYLLLYDTDIDFIVFTGGSRTTRYGADFSRNITSNLEVHGEFAYTEDFQKRYIDSKGSIHSSTYDTTSYLLGVRYLSERETTYILEYYRNGTGFTKEEFQDFYRFVDRAYDQYLATGSSAFLAKAQNLSQGNYGRPNPGQDYLYLRVSQKEPFDILYFTPSLTTIVNLNDSSFSITPEVAYTGITNLELRLKAMVLVGGKETEFGEKPNDYRIEFRARYYF
ncbi:MAG: hypothetical protein H6Q42_3346 [Deltaproteobacteria bacterium]|nr:hypothetical protein [Deltaproteobacteria bacterium]